MGGEGWFRGKIASFFPDLNSCFLVSSLFIPAQFPKLLFWGFDVAMSHPTDCKKVDDMEFWD